MAAAVEQLLTACGVYGLDAYVYEGVRSAELQALYYHRGRPPTAAYPRPVTNARSNLYSWHGYGLAVDIISRTQRWDAPESWFRQVADLAKQCGLDWGGDWKQRDLPHFQWGRCRASPSDLARTIYHQHGLEAVWRIVGAL